MHGFYGKYGSFSIPVSNPISLARIIQKICSKFQARFHLSAVSTESVAGKTI